MMTNNKTNERWWNKYRGKLKSALFIHLPLLLLIIACLPLFIIVIPRSRRTNISPAREEVTSIVRGVTYLEDVIRLLEEGSTTTSPEPHGNDVAVHGARKEPKDSAHRANNEGHFSRSYKGTSPASVTTSTGGSSVLTRVTFKTNESVNKYNHLSERHQRRRKVDRVMTTPMTVTHKWADHQHAVRGRHRHGPKKVERYANATVSTASKIVVLNSTLTSAATRSERNFITASSTEGSKNTSVDTVVPSPLVSASSTNGSAEHFEHGSVTLTATKHKEGTSVGALTPCSSADGSATIHPEHDSTVSDPTERNQSASISTVAASAPAPGDSSNGRTTRTEHGSITSSARALNDGKPMSSIGNSTATTSLGVAVDAIHEVRNITKAANSTSIPDYGSTTARVRNQTTMLTSSSWTLQGANRTLAVLDATTASYAEEQTELSRKRLLVAVAKTYSTHMHKFLGRFTSTSGFSEARLRTSLTLATVETRGPTPSISADRVPSTKRYPRTRTVVKKPTFKASSGIGEGSFKAAAARPTAAPRKEVIHMHAPMLGGHPRKASSSRFYGSGKTACTSFSQTSTRGGAFNSSESSRRYTAQARYGVPRSPTSCTSLSLSVPPTRIPFPTTLVSPLLSNVSKLLTSSTVHTLQPLSSTISVSSSLSLSTEPLSSAVPATVRMSSTAVTSSVLTSTSNRSTLTSHLSLPVSSLLRSLSVSSTVLSSTSAPSLPSEALIAHITYRDSARRGSSALSNVSTSLTAPEKRLLDVGPQSDRTETAGSQDEFLENKPAAAAAHRRSSQLTSPGTASNVSGQNAFSGEPFLPSTEHADYEEDEHLHPRNLPPHFDSYAEINDTAEAAINGTNGTVEGFYYYYHHGDDADDYNGTEYIDAELDTGGRFDVHYHTTGNDRSTFPIGSHSRASTRSGSIHSSTTLQANVRHGTEHLSIDVVLRASRMTLRRDRSTSQLSKAPPFSTAPPSPVTSPLLTLRAVNKQSTEDMTSSAMNISASLSSKTHPTLTASLPSATSTLVTLSSKLGVVTTSPRSTTTTEKEPALSSTLSTTSPTPVILSAPHTALAKIETSALSSTLPWTSWTHKTLPVAPAQNGSSVPSSTVAPTTPSAATSFTSTRGAQEELTTAKSDFAETLRASNAITTTEGYRSLPLSSKTASTALTPLSSTQAVQEASSSTRLVPVESSTRITPTPSTRASTSAVPLSRSWLPSAASSTSTTMKLLPTVQITRQRSSVFLTSLLPETIADHTQRLTAPERVDVSSSWDPEAVDSSSLSPKWYDSPTRPSVITPDYLTIPIEEDTVAIAKEVPQEITPPHALEHIDFKAKGRGLPVSPSVFCSLTSTYKGPYPIHLCNRIILKDIILFDQRTVKFTVRSYDVYLTLKRLKGKAPFKVMGLMSSYTIEQFRLQNPSSDAFVDRVDRLLLRINFDGLCLELDAITRGSLPAYKHILKDLRVKFYNTKLLCTILNYMTHSRVPSRNLIPLLRLFNTTVIHQDYHLISAMETTVPNPLRRTVKPKYSLTSALNLSVEVRGSSRHKSVCLPLSPRGMEFSLLLPKEGRGVGALGRYVRVPVDAAELCTKYRYLQRHYDDTTASWYVSEDAKWIGFDDALSLRRKLPWLLRTFRPDCVFMEDVQLDDPKGQCPGGPFSQTAAVISIFNQTARRLEQE